MKILKYKFKDNEHLIKFINIQNDEIELKSSDDALPNIAKTLSEFSPFVREICELDNNNDISVSGVSISRNLDEYENEIIGCVIIAQMKLENSTGVINLVTPHRIESFYSAHGDEGQLMPDGLIDLVHDLSSHVETFIKGNRAQGELFPSAENAA